MAETRAELEARVADLEQENAQLRRQLAGATVAGQPGQAQHRFELSEAARQELVDHGETSVGGQLKTRAEVRELLGPNQQNVDIGADDDVDQAEGE